jgi:hypothetical protein
MTLRELAEHVESSLRVTHGGDVEFDGPGGDHSVVNGVMRALGEAHRLGQISALREAAEAIEHTVFGPCFLIDDAPQWLRDRATSLEQAKQ